MQKNGQKLDTNAQFNRRLITGEIRADFYFGGLRSIKMGKTHLESSLARENERLDAAPATSWFVPTTSRLNPETDSAESNAIKPVTIFTAPKKFEGHIGIIQRNALQSWSMLNEFAEVIVLGDEPGIESTARELNLRHIPQVERTSQGTPRIDSLFERTRAFTRSPWMMFANADIILDKSLSKLLHRIAQEQLRECLIIGRRIDFEQYDRINFSRNWESRVRSRVEQKGKFASVLCKDYFLFPRQLYQDVPAFAIGRGNWDSWMVVHAKAQGWPVIDATNILFAAHQNHDHNHVGNKRTAYMNGDEATFNRRLAGGTHYIRGSLATHRFHRERGLKKVNRATLLSMVLDLPSLIPLARSVMQTRSVVPN